MVPHQFQHTHTHDDIRGKFHLTSFKLKYNSIISFFLYRFFYWHWMMCYTNNKLSYYCLSCHFICIYTFRIQFIQWIEKFTMLTLYGFGHGIYCVHSNQSQHRELINLRVDISNNSLPHFSFFRPIDNNATILTHLLQCWFSIKNIMFS